MNRRSLRPRRDWVLGMAPQVLAGKREGGIFLALSLLALGLVAVADLSAPRFGSVGAVGFLPVVACSWFLSRRATVAIVLVAIALRLLLVADGALQPVTGLAQAFTVPVLALIGRLAAVAMVRSRENEAIARRLDASRERATELEHAKAEFLRLASHELRGPLAVLRGYLSMLEEGQFGSMPAAAREVLPIMSAKAASMNVLIEQMLETSRLEDSRMQLRPEPFDLGALLDRLVGAAVPATDRTHRVVLHRPPRPVQVTADRARVQTIVANLLDNAIKYSPMGGTVRCALREEPGGVKVSVTDTGIGISEDDRARLFTRFGRIVTPETSGIPGTGLGLYLSRELARLHGGDLTLDPTSGQGGSTFTLTLPAPTAARSKPASRRIERVDRMRSEVA